MAFCPQTLMSLTGRQGVTAKCRVFIHKQQSVTSGFEGLAYTCLQDV